MHAISSFKFQVPDVVENFSDRFSTHVKYFEKVAHQATSDVKNCDEDWADTPRGTNLRDLI